LYRIFQKIVLKPQAEFYLLSHFRTLARVSHTDAALSLLSESLLQDTPMTVIPRAESRLERPVATAALT